MLQKLVVIHSMQVARGHALRQVLYQLLRQVLRQALSQVLCQSSLISLNSENGSVSFYTLPKIFFFQNQCYMSVATVCGFYSPKEDVLCQYPRIPPGNPSTAVCYFTLVYLNLCGVVTTSRRKFHVFFLSCLQCSLCPLPGS